MCDLCEKWKYIFEKEFIVEGELKKFTKGFSKNQPAKEKEREKENEENDHRF